MILLYFYKQQGVKPMTNKHISPRWPAKLERKIDIYHNTKGYLFSSNAYRRCKDAVAGVEAQYGYEGQVFARFAKQD